ncbi:MAG: hypothetical protein HY060_01450 [Proteobacteria bacterium]|nr:hypothetical protein [Pseudomonadota bacterium]
MAPALDRPADAASATLAALAIDTTGRLLQRIALLEQLARGDAATGVPPRLIHAMLERLKLFVRMIDRIGVDDTRGPLVVAVLREAEASCLGCSAVGRCRDWLDAPDRDAAYHEFCDNAALFDVLPRRGP